MHSGTDIFFNKNIICFAKQLQHTDIRGNNGARSMEVSDPFQYPSTSHIITIQNPISYRQYILIAITE
jgi:hypothetical protein